MNELLRMLCVVQLYKLQCVVQNFINTHTTLCRRPVDHLLLLRGTFKVTVTNNPVTRIKRIGDVVDRRRGGREGCRFSAAVLPAVDHILSRLSQRIQWRHEAHEAREETIIDG